MTPAEMQLAADRFCDEAYQGHMAGVRDMLESHGACLLHARNKHGRTPLIYAVWGLRYEMIEFLLQQGADINQQDLEGRTPLMWAARGAPAAGRAPCDMVIQLLDGGARPEIRDKDGKTAGMHAEERGHPANAGMIRGYMTYADRLRAVRALGHSKVVLRRRAR